jgi:siderophore synthetase component
MFITITLQLCQAAVLESLAQAKLLDREEGYHLLRTAIDTTLTSLEAEGVATQVARDRLFFAPTQPVKYLLQSGSLLDKKVSGAADINKFYGQSGPNFLRRDRG